MLLTLIGYRATGKTTLAKLLAERLAWAWVDSDDEIERRAGKSITDLFEQDGEPAFRKLETAVIVDLCRRERLVLAAGGGAPLNADNRRIMRKAGKVVWLRARPETILARMEGDVRSAARRPSLSQFDPAREVTHLLDERTPIYRASADLTVDTDGKTPEEFADEIIGKLKASLYLGFRRFSGGFRY